MVALAVEADYGLVLAHTVLHDGRVRTGKMRHPETHGDGVQVAGLVYQRLRVEKRVVGFRRIPSDREGDRCRRAVEAGDDFLSLAAN